MRKPPSLKRQAARTLETVIRDTRVVARQINRKLASLAKINKATSAGQKLSRQINKKLEMLAEMNKVKQAAVNHLVTVMGQNENTKAS